MKLTTIRLKLSIRLLTAVVCCYTLLFSSFVHAQQFHFHNLSVEDGLIQSQATCLSQDETGNLWIGTLGGLSRFDGRNFTNFSVKNGLLHNFVLSVGTDSKGNVWTGGPEGISCFDGKSFKHFRMKVRVVRHHSNLQQISVVNDTVWWQVQGELYYVANGKIKFFSTPKAEGFISAILIDKSAIWIAKEGRIYRFQNNTWDSLTILPGNDVQTADINHIFKGNNGTIWMSGNQGLYKVSNKYVVPHAGSETSFALPTWLSSGAEDNNGSLWLGAGSGAILLDSNGVHYYNKRNGLTDNSINDVLKDSEGSIWMASDGQGIFRFSGTQFTGIGENTGLPSAQVSALAFNGADSLFIGTYDAGVYIYKDRKVTSLFFPSNPTPPVMAMCYTPSSVLWLGTRSRGLWSYANGIFKQYDGADYNFPSRSVNSLYVDTFDRLWIGFSNGVMVREEGIFKTADTNNSPVYSFLTIGFDSTLIATEGGLRLFHAGEAMPFVTGTIVDSFAIQCFILRGRELWLGSGDNGVIRYDLDTRKTTVINKNNGLRSDFIYNIVADDFGNVWVGTGFGIHKISIREEGDPLVTFYGKAQGIMGMESNINSVLKLPNGSIWFGTTNGALHYSPHTTAVVAVPSQIVLQSVKIAGENRIDPKWYDSLDAWYEIPYNLRLPYKKNNIAFSFQAITLSGAQQVLYRYRIDGLDAPWSDWSTTNSVTFSALPPGNYVFRVQCRSDAGTTAPELSYSFEIITPIEKTMWFRFAILLACLLTGILVQYSYNSRKQRREKLLAKLRAEEQGKIRTRTAEDFHDEIGNKLTRINVLTNVLKNKVTLTPETTRILGQIEDNTAQLYSGTRDILWSLKPSNDGLYEILHRICDFGTELFEDTDIRFSFTGNDAEWRKFRLNMEMSRNLIMIFKEAMNNTLKYAKPKNVSLEISVKQKNMLQIVLKDDGVGFDVHAAKKGNGLANMNTRAGRLNGKLYIDSRKDKGTIISLTFKIPSNR